MLSGFCFCLCVRSFIGWFCFGVGGSRVGVSAVPTDHCVVDFRFSFLFVCVFVRWLVGFALVFRLVLVVWCLRFRCWV
jgi:hypothetical protein